eukprot:1317049-Amorphochlora_amoeboformis.AAC.1
MRRIIPRLLGASRSLGLPRALPSALTRGVPFSAPRRLISIRDPSMLDPNYEYERLRTNVTTPEDAVNNILYNTPAVSRGPVQRRTISALVNNHPGVLVQVTGVLAARGEYDSGEILLR